MYGSINEEQGNQISIEESTIRNNENFDVQFTSIGWISNKDNISGSWKAEINGKTVFAGEADNSVNPRITLKSNEVLKVQWYSDMRGERVSELAGKSAGAASYTFYAEGEEAPDVEVVNASTSGETPAPTPVPPGPGPTPPEPPEPTYSISGHLEPATGEAFAEGFTITVNSDPAISVTTDADGNYKIEGLKKTEEGADGYTLTVTKTGYITYESQEPIVIEDEDITDVDFTPDNIKPISYTIKFDINGGMTGEMASIPTTYDKEVKLTKNAYSSTRAKWARWNTKADGTGTPYADEATVSNLTTVHEAEVTLYAQWLDYVIHASFDKVSHTLHLYFDDQESDDPVHGEYLGFVPLNYQLPESLPWDSVRKSVYDVVIDEDESYEPFDNARPVNTSYWFYDMTYLTELDISKLNTSETTNMRYMFANCKHLTTIYVGEAPVFSTAKVTTGNNLFTNDVKLVGGQGTPFSVSHDDTLYARPDLAGTNSPGYFTATAMDRSKKIFRLIYEGMDEGFQVINFPENDEKYIYVDDEEDTCEFIISTRKPNRLRTVWENLACWYAFTPDGEFKEFQPGDKIKVGAGEASEWKCDTVVISAMWQPPYIYGINYESPLVTDVDNMPDNEYQESLDQKSWTWEISNNVPLALGYKFAYWYDNRGNKYYPNQGDTLTQIAGEGVRTLNAAWEDDPNQTVVYTFLNNGKLTFYYGNYKDAKEKFNDPRGTKVGQRVLPYYESEEDLPWYDIKGSINAVAFDPSFNTYQPQDGYSMDCWFKDLTALYEIDLTNINTDKLNSCKSMFEGCSNLATIYDDTSDEHPFSPPAVGSTADMFLNCKSLVGAKGKTFETPYDPAHVDGTYARVATAANKGYFTEGKVVPPVLPYRYQIMFSSEDQDSITNMPASISQDSDQKTFMMPLDFGHLSIAGVPTRSGYNFWGWKDLTTGDTYYSKETDTQSSTVYLNSTNQVINLRAVWGVGKDMRARAYVQNLNSDNSVLTFVYEEAETIHTGWDLLGEIPENATNMSQLPWRSVINTVTGVEIQESMQDFPVLSTSYWFSGLSNKCTSLLGLNNIEFKTEHKADEVVTASHMFENANLTNAEQSTDQFIDTSNVEDLSYMFSKTVGMTTLGNNAVSIASATNLEGFFMENTTIETVDLTSWDTSKVRNVKYMFKGCVCLKTVFIGEGWNLDLAKSWAADTQMFMGCAKIQGGNGTLYDSNYVNSLYAIADCCYYHEDMLSVFNAAMNRTIIQKGYLTYKDPDALFNVKINYKYVDNKGEEQSYPFSQYVTVYQNTTDTGKDHYCFATVQGSEIPSFNPEATYQMIDPKGNALEVTGWDTDKESGEAMYIAGDSIDLSELNLEDSDNDVAEKTLDLYAAFDYEQEPYVTYEEYSHSLIFLYCSEQMKDELVDIYNASGFSIKTLGVIPESYTKENDLPWHEYRSKIYRTIFHDSFRRYKPQSISYWFSNMPYITDIDISMIDPSAVKSMNYAFYNDPHLAHIYADRSFATNRLITPATGQEVFTNDKNLVARSMMDGSKYSYDPGAIDYTKAIINGENNLAGYFTFSKFMNTNINNPDLTRIAILVDGGYDEVTWDYYSFDFEATFPLRRIIEEGLYERPYGYEVIGWNDSVSGTYFEPDAEVTFSIASPTRCFTPVLKYVRPDDRPYAVLDYEIDMTDAGGNVQNGELIGMIVHLYWDNKDPMVHTVRDAQGNIDFSKITEDPVTHKAVFGFKYLGEINPNYDVKEYDGYKFADLPWSWDSNFEQPSNLFKTVTGFNIDPSFKFAETADPESPTTGAKMQNLAYFFAYMPNITSLDLSNLDMAHAYSFEGMFQQYPISQKSHERVPSPDSNDELDIAESFSELEANVDKNYSVNKGIAESLRQDNKNKLNVGSSLPFKLQKESSSFQGKGSLLENIKFPANVIIQATENSKSSCARMFCYCTNLKSIDMTKWNLNNAYNFQQIFYLCIKLSSVKLPDNFTPAYDLITSPILQQITKDAVYGTNFYEAFIGCISLCSINLNSMSFKQDDSAVEDFTSMFAYCFALCNVHIPYEFNARPISLYQTFLACFSLQSLDLTNLNVSKTMSMHYLFYKCDLLKTIFANSETWNTEKCQPIMCRRMFTDCTSLIGGFGTAYDKDKVDLQMATIDSSDNHGYLTGKERTLTGSTLNEFNICYKQGYIQYNGRDSVIENPWDTSSAEWPATDHFETTENSIKANINTTEPIMKKDANGNSFGKFNGYYQYSSTEVAAIIIQQYHLEEVLRNFDVSVPLDVSPRLVQPGSEVTLTTESPFVWLEASVSYNMSFYLSYYGGEFPTADLPEDEFIIDARVSHTFTISPQTPSYPGRSFMYYVDANDNVYHPGDSVVVERTASGSVEILELTAVWSRNEYATLKDGLLTIYAGTQPDDTTLDGFIGNVPSVASRRSIYLVNVEVVKVKSSSLNQVIGRDTSMYESFSGYKMMPWYKFRESVLRITFDVSFASPDHQNEMSNYYEYFKEMTSVIECDMTNFYVDGLSPYVDMDSMFQNCSSLRTLYLGNDRTSLVNYVNEPSFSSELTFNGCRNLVGGNGYKYTDYNYYEYYESYNWMFYVNTDEENGFFTAGSFKPADPGKWTYSIIYDKGELAENRWFDESQYPLPVIGSCNVGEEIHLQLSSQTAWHSDYGNVYKWFTIADNPDDSRTYDPGDEVTLSQGNPVLHLYGCWDYMTWYRIFYLQYIEGSSVVPMQEFSGTESKSYDIPYREPLLDTHLEAEHYTFTHWVSHKNEIFNIGEEVVMYPNGPRDISKTGRDIYARDLYLNPQWEEDAHYVLNFWAEPPEEDMTAKPKVSTPSVKEYSDNDEYDFVVPDYVIAACVGYVQNGWIVQSESQEQQIVYAGEKVHLTKDKNEAYLKPNWIKDEKMAYCVLDDETSTMKVYYKNPEANLNEEIIQITSSLGTDGPWRKYSNFLTNIEFDESMQDFYWTDATYMFYEMYNLESIKGLKNLNLKACSSFEGMFYYCENLMFVNFKGIDDRAPYNLQYASEWFFSCRKLQFIDITGININHINDSAVSMGVFYQCINLESIYVTKEYTVNLSQTRGRSWFDNDMKLVGEEGTAFATIRNSTSQYARVDDPANNQPGYFTEGPSNYGDNVYSISFYSDNSFREPVYKNFGYGGNVNIQNSISDDTQYTFTLTSNTPIPESRDRKFVTWKDSNGAEYSSGQVVNLTIDNPKLNLYAEWENAYYSECAYFGYNEASQTVTIYGTEQARTQSGDMNWGVWYSNDSTWSEYWPWNNKSNVKLIKTDPSLAEVDFYPSEMYYFCYNCYSLVYVDLTYLKTDLVRTFCEFFYACESLVIVDLGYIDLSYSTNYNYMFEACQSLTTIYHDGSQTDSNYMSDCSFCIVNSLVGGNGTVWEESSLGLSSSRAKLDEPGSPGYFTHAQQHPVNVGSNIIDVSYERNPDSFYYPNGYDYLISDMMYIKGAPSRQILLTDATEGDISVDDGSKFEMNNFKFDCWIDNSTDQPVEDGKVHFNVGEGITNFYLTPKLKLNDNLAYTTIEYNEYGIMEMHLYYDDQMETRRADVDVEYVYPYLMRDDAASECAPWDWEYDENRYRDRTQKVVVDDSYKDFKFTSLNWLFSEFRGAYTFDLYDDEGNSNINTDNVRDYNSMFRECSSLISLNASFMDFSRIDCPDSSNWIYVENMFYNCTSLQKIYVNDFEPPEYFPQDVYMFDGCNKLEGGSGTTYQDIYNEYYGGAWYSRYAIIDQGDERPGYLTSISEMPETEPLIGSINYNAAQMSEDDAYTITNIPNQTSVVTIDASVDIRVSSIIPTISSGALFKCWKDVSTGAEYMPGDYIPITKTTVLNLDTQWSPNIPYAFIKYVETEQDVTDFGVPPNSYVVTMSGDGIQEHPEYGDYIGEVTRRPWFDRCSPYEISKFVIADSMKNVYLNSLTGYFWGLGRYYNSDYPDYKVKIDGLGNLNYNNSVKDLNYTFKETQFDRVDSDTITAIQTFDVEGVELMQYTFASSNFAGTLDLSSWDVGSVVSFSCMFYECGTSTDNTYLNISNWSLGEKGADFDKYGKWIIQDMFRNMFNSTTIRGTLDMSNWTFNDEFFSSPEFSTGNMVNEMFSYFTAKNIYATNTSSGYFFPQVFIDRGGFYGDFANNYTYITGGNGTSVSFWKEQEESQEYFWKALRVDSIDPNGTKNYGIFTEKPSSNTATVKYYSENGEYLLSQDFEQVAKIGNYISVQGIDKHAFDVDGRASGTYGWCLDKEQEEATYEAGDKLKVTAERLEDGVLKLYIAPKAFAYATLIDGVLTLQYGKIEGSQPPGYLGPISPDAKSVGSLPWSGREDEVTKFVIDDTLESFHTESLCGWFSGFKNLREVDGINKLDLDNVTNLSYVFYNTKINNAIKNSVLALLTEVMSKDNNVTNTSYMFANCEIETYCDLTSWKVDRITNADYMFSNATGPSYAEDPNVYFDLDGWNFANSKTMSFYDYEMGGSNYMFANASCQVSVDGWKWKPYNDTCLDGFFSNYTGLDERSGAQISNWDTKYFSSLANVFDYGQRTSNYFVLPKTLDFSSWNFVNESNPTGNYFMRGVKVSPENHLNKMQWHGAVCSTTMISYCDLSSLISPEDSFDNFFNHDCRDSWCTGMFSYCILPEHFSCRNWAIGYMSSDSDMFRGSTNMKTLDISGLSNYNGIPNFCRDCPDLTTVYFDGSITSGKPAKEYDVSNVFTNSPNVVGGNGSRPSEIGVSNSTLHPDSYYNPGLFTYNYDNRAKIVYHSKYGVPYEDWVQQTPNSALSIGGNGGWYLPEDDIIGWSTTLGADVVYTNGEMVEVPTGETMNLYAVTNNARQFYGVYSDNGLVFYYDQNIASHTGGNVFGNYVSWMNPSGIASLPWDEFRSNITNVSFDPSCLANGFMIQDMSYWFANMPNLQNIDFSNLDTSNLMLTRYMFNCDINHINNSLKEIDLSNWDTSALSHMNGMFVGLNKLKTIYVGNAWTLGTSLQTADNAQIASEVVFGSCPELVGGAGTRFNSDLEASSTDNNSGARAVIDDYNAAQPTPGYLTPRSLAEDPTHGLAVVKVKYFGSDDTSIQPVFTQTLLRKQEGFNWTAKLFVQGKYFGNDQKPAFIPSPATDDVQFDYWSIPVLTPDHVLALTQMIISSSVVGENEVYAIAKWKTIVTLDGPTLQNANDDSIHEEEAVEEEAEEKQEEQIDPVEPTDGAEEGAAAALLAAAPALAALGLRKRIRGKHARLK